MDRLIRAFVLAGVLFATVGPAPAEAGYPKGFTGGNYLLSRGYIIRGDSSGNATAYDANDSGKILVGDGTDLVSVAVSGDAALSTAGAINIADNAVEYSEIVDFGARGNLLRGGAAGAPEEFVAVTAGQVVMGDGTDVVSLAISGDATLAGTGALTIAANAVGTSEITDGTIAGADVADGALDGGKAAVVAANNTASGMLVVHYVLLTSGADAVHNVTIDDQIQVTDATCILDGAGTAGSDVIVSEAGNTIVASIDVSAGADNQIFRAATLDNAEHTIPAGGVLRIAKDSDGDDFPGARCYVYGIRTSP